MKEFKESYGLITRGRTFNVTKDAPFKAKDEKEAIRILKKKVGKTLNEKSKWIDFPNGRILRKEVIGFGVSVSEINSEWWQFWKKKEVKTDG